jgi:hypothetical protein
MVNEPTRSTGGTYMELLLSLKALGNKELIRQIKMVEAYQESRDCKIYVETCDDGLYVYDSKNVEFLLRIHINIVVDHSKELNIYDAV